MKKILSLIICSALCFSLLSCDILDKYIKTATNIHEIENEPTVSYQIEFTEYVQKYAKEYGVEEALIYAVIKCESNYKPTVTSSVGAMGLMQMMPATFKDMQNRLKEELDDEKLYDPEISIKYGTYYLKYLYNYFDDWSLVPAAYNAGMGNVSKWLKNPEYSSDGKLTNIPFPETARYVIKIETAYAEYKKLLSTEEK